MKYGPLILIYVAMLVFDAFIVAGTAFLVAEYDWSSWWFLIALFLCAGSNPKNMIRVWRGEPEVKPNY